MDSGFFSTFLQGIIHCFVGTTLQNSSIPPTKKGAKKNDSQRNSVEGGQMGLHDEGECVLLRAPIAKGTHDFGRVKQS